MVGINPYIREQKKQMNETQILLRRICEALESLVEVTKEELELLKKKV